MADDERDESDKVECWRLTHEGAAHLLELQPDGVFNRTFRWTVDDGEVAAKRTSDDRFTLVADGQPMALSIRMATFGDSARRVALFTGDNTAVVHAAAATGLGGTDLDPDPGTRAARRNEMMAAHPWRYTAKRTITAIATIALPILFFWLLSQLLGVLPKPDIDLPEIPLPDVDLPDVPLPDIDLPSIDLPELPGWVKQLRALAPYVVPVGIAFAIARVEVRRRRQALERSRARSADVRAHQGDADADGGAANDAATADVTDAADADPR